MILFKGGIVERGNMCRELGIKSMNIELLGKLLVKTYSHDTREEVNFYYKQLIDSKLLKKRYKLCKILFIFLCFNKLLLLDIFIAATREQEIKQIEF